MPAEAHPERLRHPTRRAVLRAGGGLVLGALGLPLAACGAAVGGSRASASGTGLVSDPRYREHLLREGHPESPARLAAIDAHLAETGLAAATTPVAPAGDPVAAIAAVHPPAHVARVDEHARDPAICELAVAGGLAAVDAVCTGRVRNAFCALRPPGHHAEDAGLYGFCFYNNVAIAARHAQRRHGCERVLIVDWDYHHGNGTEWAFYDDPTVLFCSTHDPVAFPGTGGAERRGRGAGRGYNLNLPLAVGSGDREILGVLERGLLPLVADFAPDLVLVSAGFDGRRDDPLGRFAITDAGFAALTRLVRGIAEEHAEGRLVAMLEGGYQPDGLARAVAAHLHELLA